MTIEELGQATKKKYPAYKNISDLALGNKILEKYPVYKSRIDTSQQQAPQKNLSSIIVDTGKTISKGFQDFQLGTVKGAFSTVQGMANLGEKVLSNTVGKGIDAITGKSVRPKVAQMPKSWTDPTNTMQKIGKGVEQVAEFMIPSAVMSGAGKTRAVINATDKFINSYKAGNFITGTAKLAARMGLGAIETGGIAALQTGGDKKTTKNAAIIGAAMPVAGSAVDKIGKGIQGIGKKIGFTVIKPIQADIKDGFKIDNVYKYNTGGSLEDTLSKTNKQMNSLGSQLKEKIGQSGKTIDLNKLFDETAIKLESGKATQFGSQTKISGALEQLKGEIALQGNGGLVDLPTAQLVKRGAGTMGSWKFGMQDPESKAVEKVYNAFYNVLKTEIENSSPAGVKEINKQLSELIPIHNAALRRLPIAERNNALSLTDVISLTGMALDPKALGVTIINKLTKSGQIGNALVKQGVKLGQPSKIAPLIRGAIVKSVNNK